MENLVRSGLWLAIPLAAFVGGALMILGGRRLKVVKLVEGHGVWISGVDAGCLSKHFQPAPRECWEAA